MDAADLHAWANTIIGIGALATTLLLAFRKTNRQQDREWGRIVFQVNTMWDSFIASGVSKGISKGMIEMNSPVRLVGGSDKLLESLSERLQRFRRDECPDC